ncbi:antichymotrypsin-2 isoform X2 [Amyelois transitella]|uniref:antichymotrypsin-2 isoform X2 n=1 Tax=Amyelois transitella TaxID=680683 RepID=UPI00298FAFCA|nr:antichymotrypsin-2 isoform X2 [Amyelois transitella]
MLFSSLANYFVKLYEISCFAITNIVQCLRDSQPMWSVLLVVLSILLCFSQEIYCTSDMDQKALSSAVAKFSAKFCNELEKNNNVVSSPLSAEFVLALLTLGTTDVAHTELLTVLGIPNDEAIRESFSKVTSKLKSLKGITLNVANKVYIMEGAYDLQSPIKSDAVRVFDAELEKINFSKSDESAKIINTWVENKTNNKIKDLLSPDSLDGLTRLVLVNALYFKGTWEKQFDSNMTKDQPFHVNAATSVNVPMMYQENQFYYGESEELQAQLLAMPYVGDEARMLIVLPKEIEGLSAVLKKLAGGYNILDETERMFRTKVQVTIPKFKIETEIDLKSLLPKLGIKQIFDEENSGLTKILNSGEKIHVSKAIQKAFIEVNEEGAEAAAATAMVVAMCMAMVGEPQVPRFVADRPFLAVILDQNSVPYFYATYAGKK